MDDSKLRLRRSAGQHASSLLCVEEGNGTDRGSSNSSNLGIGCLIGASKNKSPTNSNSHLNLNSLGSSTTTSSTTKGGALSALLSYNNGRKNRRIKQRHSISSNVTSRISRRKILSKLCQLLLGGFIAAIVSVTLSLTLLPKQYSNQVRQVDYHHQFQNEVIFLYQKLEDNRQNYHSVVDNYHPNGMSYMHKHHHHIQDPNNNSINNPNINNMNTLLTLDDVETAIIGPIIEDKRKDKYGITGPITGPVIDKDSNESKDTNTNKDVFNKLKKKKKKKNLRHPPSSSDTDTADSIPLLLEVRGVHDSRHDEIIIKSNNDENTANKHKRPEIITCGDGVTVGFLNDDYCDCPYDGLDEPDTSACSNVLVSKLKFSCGRRSNNDNRSNGNGGGDMSKLKTTTKWIYSSRVNDGIIDCPDGSDEYGYIIAEQHNQQHEQ